MARSSPVRDNLIELCSPFLKIIRRGDLIDLCVEKGFNRDTAARIIDAGRRSLVEGVCIRQYLDRSRIQKLEWYSKNQKELQFKSREYYQQNKEVGNLKAKAYLKTEKGQKNRRARKAYRYNNDPVYRAEFLIRQSASRVRKAVDRPKIRHTFSELGYSPSQYYNHMIKTLPKEVKYEDCQHDHIIPVSFLLACNIQEINIVNSLDNMQLLSKEENQRKRDSVDLTLARGVVLKALIEKGIICEI